MTSNGFTLADPNDRGILDVVGFDTSAPAVIADFVRSKRVAPGNQFKDARRKNRAGGDESLRPQISDSIPVATNVAIALDIAGESHIRPVTWEEWITLPLCEGDHSVRTVRGAIRVPTVIVALNFARVPKKRPKLSARSIRERDGNHCQYTGRRLHPDEGSLDHVVPRSRGGADTWENLVCPRPQTNSRGKGNRRSCPGSSPWPSGMGWSRGMSRGGQEVGVDSMQIRCKLPKRLLSFRL